jgi:hypothetical protein
MNHWNRNVTIALALIVLAIINGYAQKPKPSFTFTAIASTASVIGGHAFTPDTHIDSVALNDVGGFVFLARWTDGGKERTALFSSKALIAQDGNNVDGKVITRILPVSLQINTAGVPAFEATYGNPGQTGIFAGKDFAIALVTSGTNDDFVLTDDHKILLRRATPAPPGFSKRSLLNGIIARLPVDAQRAINNNPKIPVYIDPNLPMQQAVRSIGQPAATAQRGPIAPVKACAVPEFPYPFAWGVVHEEVTGIITSHLFEGGQKTKPFNSRFFGQVSAPFRLTQFDPECHPSIIVIGDTADSDRLEAWTPYGPLTFTKADGYLAFEGFSGKVRPTELTRADTPIRANRHAQMLIPVNVDNGFAILLASPNDRPR